METLKSGINSGVVQHVSAALADTSNRSRANIVSIGIAPWGLLKVCAALIFHF
jgi:hypothetical protein